MQVWPTVLRELRGCGDDLVGHINIDPQWLGLPCQRRRIYLVMLHRPWPQFFAALGCRFLPAFR